MLKKSVFFFVFCLLFPISSFSLGLGDITVFSTLNAPLKAQIILLDSENNLIEDFVIKNASFSTYKRAGLPRPESFKKVRFKAIKTSNGSIIIELSSKKPIREPFITFIADLKWPKGHLNREYTFLLDPPDFIHKQIRKNKTTQLKTPTKSVNNAAKKARSNKSALSRKNRKQAFSYSTTSKTAPNKANSTTYTVKHADTLWEIAKKIKPHKNLSTYQTMQALFQLNPHAFINNNINLLKQGQVLALPDDAQIYSSMTQKKASTNKKTAQYKQNVITKQVEHSPNKMLMSDIETRAKSAIAKNKPGKTIPQGESQLKIIPTTETLLNTPITSKADLRIINQALQQSITTIKSLQSENETLSEKINALTSQLETLDSHNKNLNGQISVITQQLNQQETDSLPAKVETPETKTPEVATESANNNKATPLPETTNKEASSHIDIQKPETKPLTLEVDSPLAQTNHSRSFVRGLLANPVIAFALAIFTILTLVATLLILRVQNDKRKQRKKSSYIPYPSSEKPATPVKTSPTIAPKAKAPIKSVPTSSSLQGTDISDEKDEEDMDFFEYFEKKMNAPDDNARSGETKQDSLAEDEEETDIRFELNIATTEIEAFENSLSSSNDSSNAISEIDTYIAYGNYAEAETHLINELQKMPTSKDLHLKLFECYSSSNQRKQFIKHVKNNIDLLNVDLVLRHRVENIFQQSWNEALKIHQL